jgi:peptidoglycan/LPS O-acetylase OafA/YrhL
VAILLVLVSHLVPPEAAGPLAATARTGWMGVDLFFSLSGFLITGILLDTIGQPGWLRSFVVRRALRIWPLYMLVIGATTLWAWGWPTIAPAEAAGFREYALWYWTHTVNWLPAFADGDAEWPVWLRHFWSLSAEEQMYVVWPGLVAWCRTPERTARCAAWCALSIAAVRAVSGITIADEPLGRALVMSRGDSLLLGGALAAFIRTTGGALRLRSIGAVLARRLSVALAGAIAVGAVLIHDESGTQGELGVFVAALPVVALVAAVLVTGAHAGSPAGWWPRLLSARWLRATGRISYGLYVLHVPVFVALHRAAPDSNPWLLAAARVVMTGALAWLSWQLWEKPWLALKRLVPRPRPEPEAATARGRRPPVATVDEAERRAGRSPEHSSAPSINSP